MGAISDCGAESPKRRVDGDRQRKKERCLFQDHGEQWPRQHKHHILQSCRQSSERSMNVCGMR